jgi:hypothetical protein
VRGVQKREFAVLNASRPEESLPGEAPEGAKVPPLQCTAYDALFGPFAPVRQGVDGDEDAEEDGSAEGGKGGAKTSAPLKLGGGGSGPPVWQELMDAPVHALPPLSVLCPAFLDLLLAAGQSPPQP